VFHFIISEKYLAFLSLTDFIRRPELCLALTGRCAAIKLMLTSCGGRRYLVIRDGSTPVFFTVIQRLSGVVNVGVEMTYCGEWGDSPFWANLQNFITTYESIRFHTRSPLLLNDGKDVSFYIVTPIWNVVEIGCGSNAVRLCTGYVSGKFYCLLIAGKNRP
jgi:hypothetical protein